MAKNSNSSNSSKQNNVSQVDNHQRLHGDRCSDISKKNQSNTQDDTRSVLDRVIDEYNIATSTLSEIIRKSCYGLIAALWALAISDNRVFPFDKICLIVMAFVVLSLLCDILQYIWKGHALQRLKNNCNNKFGNKDKNFYPHYISAGATFLFNCKIVFILIAFVVLVWKLIRVIVTLFDFRFC